MKLPKTLFGNGAVAACGFYFMAIANLFPGPLEKATAPTTPKDVALAICFLGFVATLGWWAYVSRIAAKTVWAYFSRMGFMVVSIAISLLAWYIDAMIIRPGLVGHPAVSDLTILNWALALVMVHQFIRGFLTMRRRWTTTEEIFDSLRTARLVTAQAAQKYDYAFYVSTTLVIAAVSRYLDAQSVVFYVGGTILALVIPHICGAQLSRRLILRRLFPNDAPLPMELQI